MENSQQDFNLNGTNLMKMIWDKRKLLIYSGACAFAVSAVISFLITPQFVSVAILYPPISNQVSKEVLNTTMQRGLTIFGNDEEVEQLLQVLSTQALRDVIIRKQGLIKHWRIDSASRYVRHTSYQYFESNISFRPTAYRSVEIEVYDEVPEKAADIANVIVEVADSLMRNIRSGIAAEAIKVVEAQLQLAEQEGLALEDSLDQVMKQGAMHLEVQTKEIYKALARAIGENNVPAEKRLRKMYDQLAEQGVPLTKYSNSFINNLHLVKELKNYIRLLKIETIQSIPSQFVVDKAIPSDKKASPKKALIVISSTLSSVFFAIFMLVLVGFFKKSINPHVFSQE